MEEIWKSINDFEGFYEVSNFGRVRSIDRYVNGNGITCNFQFVKGKILHPVKDKLGYFRVMLRKNRKYKVFLVHRLVANAFIENAKKLPYINHKDENPSNNCVDNLEWCSAQYNVTYGNCQAKITKYKIRSVIQYDKNMNFIKEWDSLKAAADFINVAQQNISACCRNRRKACGGFIWRYKNDN